MLRYSLDDRRLLYDVTRWGCLNDSLYLGLHKITPVSMLVDKGQNFLENTKLA